MQEARSKISLVLLLLFVVMTAAAEDGIRQGSCRRGVLLPTTRTLRVQSTPRQAGGDFYRGDRRQLVVLAAFPDQPFQNDEATTLARWDKIFNAVGYQEGSFVGSVHDYFYAQSYGQFNLTFDLIPVMLPDSARRYRSTDEDDEYSQFMVDDIVDALQTQSLDWSQYDWNGDGYVNQLLIIYAGKGMNAGGGSNTIWPHQWWLSLHVDQTTPVLQYRSYRTVTSGDREFKIDCYCCVQEVVELSSTKTSFGTICHEYTHCFGFPDFYSSSNQTPRTWDLMDYGNYNAAGYCPPGYSAHERWLMGWVSPTELTAATSVSQMPALCYEPHAYLIRNDGYDNEYYVVENRQQSGWDSYLPGSGLLVFHVDFDESIWTSIQVAPNDNTAKLRYHIFPANNRSSYYSSSGWTYPYQANDSLTRYSQPVAKLNHANTDGTLLMDKSLLDIRVDGGLASFRFTRDPATAIIPVKSTRQPEVLYHLGPVSIVRDSDGVVKKVVK